MIRALIVGIGAISLVAIAWSHERRYLVCDDPVNTQENADALAIPEVERRLAVSVRGRVRERGMNWPDDRALSTVVRYVSWHAKCRVTSNGVLFVRSWSFECSVKRPNAAYAFVDWGMWRCGQKFDRSGLDTIELANEIIDQELSRQSGGYNAWR